MTQRYLADLMMAAVNAACVPGVTAEKPSGRFVPETAVSVAGQTFHFRHSVSPFNPAETLTIIDNKWELYRSAGDVLNMPFTKSYLKSETDCESLYQALLKEIKTPENCLDFPVVLKPNQGSLSVNVCICHDENELRTAVHLLHEDNEHGELILLQQYIGPAEEFRAVFFNGQIVYAFHANPDHVAPDAGVRLGAKANPVFWEGARRGEIKDEHILAQAQKFGDFLYTQLGAVYCAIDMRLDQSGKLWLLEANSSPMGLDGVIRDLPEGRKIIDDMILQMIQHMQTQAVLDNTKTQIEGATHALTA